MTPEAMREIRERLDGITNGHIRSESDKTVADVRYKSGDADGPFIAHAPADIRVLLDAVADRDALLAELRNGHQARDHSSCRFIEEGIKSPPFDNRCSLCKKIDALKEGK